jgi:hypothetical protein
MIPTLSQVEAYTTDHLVEAADHWDGLADRWEDAHWQVRNQAHSLDWQGFAHVIGRVPFMLTRFCGQSRLFLLLRSLFRLG